MSIAFTLPLANFVGLHNRHSPKICTLYNFHNTKKTAQDNCTVFDIFL